MSADNWAYCPQCAVDVKEAQAARLTKAEQSYGKVPPADYMRLLESAKVVPELDQTFREDYELGVQKDGTFFLSYSGACTLCKCAFTYRHETNILTKPAK